MEDNIHFLRQETLIPRTPYLRDFLPLDKNNKTNVVNPAILVEKVLLSRLKSGDYQAFTTIFTAYYKDLVLFASRFTIDLSTAEEIVQDTFVRFWEDRERFNIKISLKAYFLKTVKNRCIDWYRHKKIMQSHENFVKNSSPQFEYDTDSYILYSELHEQIETALGMLPEEISEAFRLNRYKGLKYNEIADLLHVSVRTIEVRIGKALNMLRNQLKEYF